MIATPREPREDPSTGASRMFATATSACGSRPPRRRGRIAATATPFAAAFAMSSRPRPGRCRPPGPARSRGAQPRSRARPSRNPRRAASRAARSQQLDAEAGRRVSAGPERPAGSITTAGLAADRRSQGGPTQRPPARIGRWNERQRPPNRGRREWSPAPGKAASIASAPASAVDIEDQRQPAPLSPLPRSRRVRAPAPQPVPPPRARSAREPRSRGDPSLIRGPKRRHLVPPVSAHLEEPDVLQLEGQRQPSGATSCYRQPPRPYRVD